MNKTFVITMIVFLLLELIVFFKEAFHAIIVSVRLNRYLKENYYALWRDLSSFKNLGPGLVNSSKSLPWLFNNDDNEEEDEKLMRLKDAARIRTRWFFITGGAFLLTLTSIFVGSLVYALVFL
ncbi:MAG: hypothetical protein WC340_15385 [Kiritimatiellia bacterium]